MTISMNIFSLVISRYRWNEDNSGGGKIEFCNELGHADSLGGGIIFVIPMMTSIISIRLQIPNKILLKRRTLARYLFARKVLNVGGVGLQMEVSVDEIGRVNDNSYGTIRVSNQKEFGMVNTVWNL